MITTHQELIVALDDFAKNNPEFPIGYVEVKVVEDAEVPSYYLSYSPDATDEVTQTLLDSQLSYEDFEILVAEFWDDIDWYESEVGEAP